MTRFRNGRANPSFSPDGNRIVFVKEASGRRVLQLMTSTGEMGPELGPGEFPTWSPVGDQIAFVKRDGDGSQVWSSRSDGENLKQLTQGDSSGYPAFSPDGRQVVVSRAHGDSIELFIIDSDGSNLRQLTSTPDQAERQPSWSPDGAWIAFTAEAADSPGGWERSIFVIPASGGNARQLTSSKFNDTRPGWLR